MSWNPLDPHYPEAGNVNSIEVQIIPRTRDLGGFEVRRALPAPARQNRHSATNGGSSLENQLRKNPNAGGVTNTLDKVHIHTYHLVMMKSSMADCNGFATRQAARYITRLYERHLAAADVTSAQFSILVLLSEAPGMTMNELADAMVMERTSLVRAIKPMERDGWLKAARAAKDTRILVLSLTDAGESKLQEALPLWQKAQREFEAQVGSERAAQWRRDFLELTRGT